jgi:hypothetical protein
MERALLKVCASNRSGKVAGNPGSPEMGTKHGERSPTEVLPKAAKGTAAFVEFIWPVWKPNEVPHQLAVLRVYLRRAFIRKERNIGRLQECVYPA